MKIIHVGCLILGVGALAVSISLVSPGTGHSPFHPTKHFFPVSAPQRGAAGREQRNIPMQPSQNADVGGSFK